MGNFRVAVEIARVSDQRAEFVAAGRLIVDSGAEVSWIPEAVLENARISVRKSAQPFLMASGDEIIRDVGYAILRAEGFETIDEVVFAKQGDLGLLGARTLEGFNAMVDLDRRRLVAGGPIPAA